MAIRVDYQSLLASQAFLRTKRGELDGILTSIQQHITQLTSSDFVTDQASGSLEESMRAFVTHSSATIADLDEYARHLGTIVDSYQRTDQGLGLRV